MGQRPDAARHRHDPDFVVADLSLADAGRHQLRLAENEMPGLMAYIGVPVEGPYKLDHYRY